MRRWSQALGAVAGLMGAAGVGLAAVGAHRSSDPTVTIAAYFLLFHAAALVGLCAAALRRPTSVLLAAGSMIALGATLFSGDLALRALAGLILVHMAAPTGGILAILGWLATAAALGGAPPAEESSDSTP